MLLGRVMRGIMKTCNENKKNYSLALFTRMRPSCYGDFLGNVLKMWDIAYRVWKISGAEVEGAGSASPPETFRFFKTLGKEVSTFFNNINENISISIECIKSLLCHRTHERFLVTSCLVCASWWVTDSLKVWAKEGISFMRFANCTLK